MLITEAIEGISLRKYLDIPGDRRAFSRQLEAMFLPQLLSGLSYAHDHGIIHGLLSPASICFCADDTADKYALANNEPKRLALYQSVAALIRAYANLANEMEEAGYTPAQAHAIKAEVQHFENVRQIVKKASGDELDLKSYEPVTCWTVTSRPATVRSYRISATLVSSNCSFTRDWERCRPFPKT